MTTREIVPRGYLKNANGHLVPEDTIDAYDIARDELVRELSEKARTMREALSEFKYAAMDDIDAFVDLSAERYDVALGGQKGNLSLMSFDGSLMIKVQVQDRLVFDERIHAAKEIIDECIRRWAADAGAEIKALVQHAFQTDREGKLNISRILALTRIDIKDERWEQGMKAIKDSLSTASTARYIRFYERDARGEYTRLDLDIATV